MESVNITAYTTDNTQIEAIKAFMKALKIKFDITKEETYNPEFVAKIKQSEDDIKNGRVTKVKKEDLKQFLGL